MDLFEIVNKICGHLQEHHIISLDMENGYAGVSLTDTEGNYIELPDSTDKTLIEQLNDALCVANGWDVE